MRTILAFLHIGYPGKFILVPFREKCKFAIIVIILHALIQAIFFLVLKPIIIVIVAQKDDNLEAMERYEGSDMYSIS